LKKAIITVIDIPKRLANVSLPELNGVVVTNVKISRHIALEGVNSLEIGDLVAVEFFESNLTDGIVISHL
jgi:hypothetical protein